MPSPAPAKSTATSQAYASASLIWARVFRAPAASPFGACHAGIDQRPARPQPGRVVLFPHRSEQESASRSGPGPSMRATARLRSMTGPAARTVGAGTHASRIGARSSTVSAQQPAASVARSSTGARRRPLASWSLPSPYEIFETGRGRGWP